MALAAEKLVSALLIAISRPRCPLWVLVVSALGVYVRPESGPRLKLWRKGQNRLTLPSNWKAAAMGQLLVMLIVPPIVGVVAYIVVRHIWEREENGAGEVVRSRDPSAVTRAEGTTTDA